MERLLFDVFSSMIENTNIQKDNARALQDLMIIKNFIDLIPMKYIMNNNITLGEIKILEGRVERTLKERFSKNV